MTVKTSPSQMLTQILDASKYTQSEVAALLNVSFATVNSWVNNKSQPRTSAIEKIELLYFEHVGQDEIDPSLHADAISRAQLVSFPKTLFVKDHDALNKLNVLFTYNTNSIEGNTMTIDDTREVVLEGGILNNRTAIEQQEARNHHATFEWLLNKAVHGEITFTHELIKEIHLRLMNSILSDAGTYRTHGVRIAGSRTTTSNPASIAKKLDDLFKDLNNTKTNVVNQLSHTHAIFEQIHPFSDGNGRVGRLLMLARAVIRNSMPPLILRSKRAAYYRYLELAQTQENYVGLEYFIATAMIDMSANISSAK